MSTAPETCESDDAIVVTGDAQDLAAIARPGIQAVIHIPPAPPAWLTEIGAAVEAGRLRLSRSVLPHATRDDIAAWLEHHVRGDAVAEPTRNALIQDILGLTDCLAAIAGAGAAVGPRRFMLRTFTEAPTTECGFHVDTVPPAAPAFGLLRVYNGAGTLYVEPANVISMADFYRDLGRRDALARERGRVRRERDPAALERLEREIAAHDAARRFLRRPDEIAVAPAGSIIAFKHVDVRYYRTDHPKSMAWIHCSPMTGSTRLVVNLTVPQPYRLPAAPRRASSA
jgi:Protein of unknown function (DUF1826)